MTYHITRKPLHQYTYSMRATPGTDRYAAIIATPGRRSKLTHEQRMVWAELASQASAQVRRPGNVTRTRGEGHPNAKLTLAQVRDIKYSADSNRAAAKRNGVSPQTASDIRHGVTWAEA